MTTWNCTTDGTAFAVGAPRCPSCGGTEVRENGDGVRSAIVANEVGWYVLDPLDTSNMPPGRTGTTSGTERSTDGEEHAGRAEHESG